MGRKSPVQGADGGFDLRIRLVCGEGEGCPSFPGCLGLGSFCTFGGGSGGRSRPYGVWMVGSICALAWAEGEDRIAGLGKRTIPDIFGHCRAGLVVVQAIHL